MIRVAFVTAGLLAATLLAAPVGAVPATKGPDVKVRRSCAALRKQLGRHVAAQLPGYVDFRNDALVWVPSPRLKTSNINLHEIVDKLSVSVSPRVHVELIARPRAWSCAACRNRPARAVWPGPSKAMSECRQ